MRRLISAATVVAALVRGAAAHGQTAASPAASPPASAFASPADSARCDSVVAAARVDSVQVGLFVGVYALDEGPSAQQLQSIGSMIAAVFQAPRPFRLSVFSGTARLHLFRPITPDTTPELRAPTLTSIYRFTIGKGLTVRSVRTTRASLMTGFDSAAMTAIREVTGMPDVLVLPEEADSTRMELRFTTDSTIGMRRMIGGSFPRMPVVDAVPTPGNPVAAFPEDAKQDSLTRGEVVLRFVVGRSGMPIPETVEVIRASGLSFLRSALSVVGQQRFTPATIRGCAIAQVVDYPFSFILPDSSLTHPIPGRLPRH